MTTIYHNPKCSKSRQSLQLLKDNGCEITVIKYNQSPPDEATLKQILDMLDMRPIDLVRQKESVFKKLNLDQHRLDDQMIIKAMIEHPILIERPIIIHNGKAVIGRPPEKVLDLLT